MAFYCTTGELLTQNIADTSTTQKHPLGKIVRAVDPTLGEGEFIYLLGVASTVVGSLVTYEPSTWQTALAPVGANKPQPIAVAMSANVAGQYGWYQISGLATMKKASTLSLAASVAVGVKTVGLVAATASGKEIQGALTAQAVTAASALTTILVSISRPHMQGRIT